MTRKDRLIEAALISVGAGATGAVIGIMLIYQVDMSDIFTLAGAIIGAAATVGGAIWVADRNSNREFAKEVDVLSSDFVKLLAQAQLVSSLSPAPEGPWSTEYRAALHEFGAKVRGSLMIVEQAIERSKSLDFRHRASLINLQRILSFSNDFYADCFESEEEPHPLDERDWRVIVPDVVERVEDSRKVLRNV